MLDCFGEEGEGPCWTALGRRERGHVGMLWGGGRGAMLDCLDMEQS